MTFIFLINPENVRVTYTKNVYVDMRTYRVMNTIYQSFLNAIHKELNSKEEFGKFFAE